LYFRCVENVTREEQLSIIGHNLLDPLSKLVWKLVANPGYQPKKVVGNSFATWVSN